MPELLAAVAPALFGAGGTAALVTAATATTAAGLTTLGAVVSIGSSLLLSAASTALIAKGQSAQDQSRRLALPSTAPEYRHVYGECRATGSPVAMAVRGEYLWACYLFNSRPSDLPDFDLYIDKRLVPLSGDPFDFDGPGAAPNAAPFYKSGITFFWVWMQRGDQTQPPQEFLDSAPWAAGDDENLFLATDAWQGRTVLWIKARHRAHPNDYKDRWVSYPPNIEADGRWSKIHDPRDEEQDAGDPDTWAWSDNHALCVLDALRCNPVRVYADDQIHWGSFIDAADISDENVALKAGGTEPRYRAAGTVTWGGGEIEDQINPLVVSGAADLIRIGGVLGLAAGAWRAPEVTLDYVLGDSMEFPDLLPGAQLANGLRVSYLSHARGGETADLRPWPIPGALAEDGGVPVMRDLALPHCPSATQAMRVRKIAGQRLRRQRRISGGQLPPEAFDLVAGATVAIALPAPYDVLDGDYEIESLHPALDPMGDSGVALRMPARLVAHSEAVYAWTAATDEEDVVDQPYDGSRSSEVALADLTEPAGLGRQRYVTGWRGGDVDVQGDGYWWRDLISGDIVTPARYVADFALDQRQINTRRRSLAKVLGLTRASTATYIDSDGVVQTAAADTARIDYTDGTGALLVEPAATNLCLRSAEIDNAAWVRTGGTGVTANAVEAPDGTMTADTVTSGNTAAQGLYQTLTVTASTQYTLPFWVRLGTLAAASFKMAIYNATAGSFTTFDVVPGVTPSADEWRRISYTFTTAAGCTSIRIYPFRSGAAVAGTFHLWGVQLETGAAASSYIPTTTAAVTRAADVPVMRGITATLDLEAVYADGSVDTFPAVSVVAGTTWPTLTKTRLIRLTGRNP